MLKTICGNCGVEMKPKYIGMRVIEMFMNPPEPYRIWSADQLKCPKCGAEVLADFADKPLAEHYQARFKDELRWALEGVHAYWIEH